MKTSFRSLMVPVVLSGLSTLAQGDITIHGSATEYTETGGNWQSMATNDIDSSGGLGTDGWFFFGNFDGVQENNQPFTQNLSSLPSYVTTVAPVAEFLSVTDELATYGAIDSPLLLDGTDFGGGAAVSRAGTDLPDGTFNNALTFTVGPLSENQTIRIGILSGTEGTADGRWDPTSITLDDGAVSATVGDHTASPLPASPGGANTAAGNTGWVFFDIDTAGTYTLGGTKRLAGNQGISFGGLTFDSIITGSNPDSDNDDLVDAWEIANFGDLDEVASGDPDLDDLTNLREQDETFTDPTLTDTDGDGANDGLEVDGVPATDPFDKDTDDDGLEDGEENTLGTNPTLTDTDGDTFDDSLEVEFGSDPTDANSVPDILVGYTETGGDWLTMGTNDIDLSGGLGTDGFIFYGSFDGVRATGQEFGADVVNLPSYVISHSAGADFASIAHSVDGYGMIDDPLLRDGTDAIGGVALAANAGIGTISEIVTFEISGLLAEQVVRVGLLGGIEGTGDGRWDPTSLSLSGGGLTQTAIDLEISPGDVNAGWIFFDLTSDGVYAINGAQRTATRGVSIGGITFDSIGGGAVNNDPDNDGLSTFDETELFETDPNNPDTDGDGQSDGDEILFAGTDPLNAGSVLRISEIDFVDGVVSLTWSSVPGRTYTLQASSDLIDWSDLTSIPAAESPETTTSLPAAEVPLAGDLKRFYRIVATPST